MKNALVFLADGFEEIEALTPVDYLRRTGEVTVTTVAVPSATMNDPYIVISSHSIPVITDMTFDEFKENFSKELPDLIFFPGGMPGSTNLASNGELLAYAEKCFESGKFVSAICAAPAVVLGKTGILKGKKWTCYPDMEKAVSESIKNSSQHIKNQPFVTDGTLITSRGAGTAEEFAMELIRLLCGPEKKENLKTATCQR